MTWSFQAEPTPNPQSMKFVANNQLLANDQVDFTDVSQAERSPLASKIFGFPWTAGVFIGRDFVTITKQDWVDWSVLAEPLQGLLKEHLESGEPVLLPDSSAPSLPADSSDDSPDVRLIKSVIENEIRPAVAMDGGDIVFHKYENKKVYLYMRGSCAGCPSSTYTLKMGIETRLKDALPEIEEVVAL